MKTARLRAIVIGVVGLVTLTLSSSAAASATVPSWAYPNGTTTRIPGVDAAIQAMSSSDAQALQNQFLFTTRPCTGPGGIGAIRCPEGQPVGTPVDVFTVGHCESEALPPGDPALPMVAAAMTDGTRYLFAVGRVSSDWLPSQYVLFFGAAGDTGKPGFVVRSQADQAVMIATDATGIRGVNTGCGAGVAQRLEDFPPVDFVLPPRLGSDGEVAAPSTQDLVGLGRTLAQLVNAGDEKGIAAMFAPTKITCPAPGGFPQPVCEGQADGKVVDGYWVGRLYSEIGAVNSAGLQGEISLGLSHLGKPATFATYANRNPFPFLRNQCSVCGTVVLAAPSDNAAGWNVALFGVGKTDQGLRLTSFGWSPGLLQPDEKVFVTGGTYTEGTIFLRADAPGPPDTGGGLQDGGRLWMPIAPLGLALVAVSLVLAISSIGRRQDLR